MAEAAAEAAAAAGNGEGTADVTESELKAGLAAADGKGGNAATAKISPKALQAALAIITKPQYETWSPEVRRLMEATANSGELPAQNYHCMSTLHLTVHDLPVLGLPGEDCRLWQRLLG
eukprot:SAG31_NODE_508_length_14732_cov_75.624547_10_plen_119_part_00